MMPRIAEFLVSWFVPCGHWHESWPQRRRNRAGRFVGPSYRVCLECGREREYTLLDPPQFLPAIKDRQLGDDLVRPAPGSWPGDCAQVERPG